MKNIRKSIKITCISVGAISVLCIAALALIDKYTDLLFYFMKLDTSDWMNISFTVLALSITVYAVVLYKEKKIRKLILCGLIFLSLGIYVCSSFGHAFTSVEDKYYTFDSPDGNYRLIAKEWSFLLGGGVHLYEEENPLFLKQLGQVGTDDGFRAIEHNAYSIEWDNNKVTFTVSMGNGSDDTTTVELTPKENDTYSKFAKYKKEFESILEIVTEDYKHRDLSASNTYGTYSLDADTGEILFVSDKTEVIYAEENTFVKAVEDDYAPFTFTAIRVSENQQDFIYGEGLICVIHTNDGSEPEVDFIRTIDANVKTEKLSDNWYYVKLMAR